MKKLFKKSIACLIAVLMVVSTMPFTAVTASAASSTIQMTAMGCFRNCDAQSFGADYVFVCNDS